MSITKDVDNDCPLCLDKGYSVAALHNKEYSISENHGKFSGASAGLIIGLGVGIASGTYEDKGTQATKRALVFAEPDAPTQISEGVSIGPLTRSCFALCILIWLTTVTSNPSSNTLFNPLEKIIFNLQHYYSPTMMPVIFLAGFISFLFDLIKDNREKDNQIERENKNIQAVYNKKLAFYNAMRYCENCNLLYDNKRNKTQTANTEGFQMMLFVP
ncbi:hypothetical protein Lbir_1921 [Legionella birminghamensis]|uniref:Transmembrane protein n=1 Tax=Legionella birminghamensis TaxID=28083 RepID=A0A378JQG2_9GAMM|nr:hypothetical protein [Legionella birminghamensis]KTC69917.1 hypothetical protein Lbir_1921 [Legionella birminghamensis]STX60885.1 Uncharacterised protein [Legionella birminghamensis]